MEKAKDEKLMTEVPVVALRRLVVFPGMVLHFDVGRMKSVAAVKAATVGDRYIFLTAQKNPDTEDPSFSELYRTGTLARIKQLITVPAANTIRVIVEGEERACIRKGYPENREYLLADLTRKPEVGFAAKDRKYSEALIRKAKEIFAEYYRYSPKNAPDMFMRVIDDNSPGAVADYIISVVNLPFEAKQSVLEKQHPLRRLERVCEVLLSEISVLKMESKIAEKVEQAVDENQREYYLREQIRALSEELDGEEIADEDENYRKRIRAIKNISEKSREKLLKECDRLKKMGNSAAAEAAVIRNYLDTVLELPFDISTDDNLDLKRARKILDEDHYGLNKVKERIVELLAVRKLAPDIRGQIICLAGPPGVGKTSVARSLARAMGRSYARVSLGGVKDEAEIRGHRKTYIGSMPGRVINAIKEAGTNNPLILFDEIDKMASDMRGDPASAMLEVLDAEQNKSFTDHYIEIPFDLSRTLFVTTANNKNRIAAPLLDRMEVIDLYSYTAEEKFNIAKKHLLPKALKKHGLLKNQLKVTDGALREIISSYTKEAGVRELERKLHDICRKTALLITSGEQESVRVSPSNLHEYLGAPKFREKLSLASEVGVTNGLAWTQTGGEMLKVEAAVMEGKGVTELTGSLGDVMKESAMAAVSYIRSHSLNLGIAEDFYKSKDIHIHVPEGAVSKDGPSAGVTMATSLVSALSGRPVNGRIAMTGEISLTGRVMPIGGLKEKTMAAYNSGIRTVIIPKENEADLEEVEKKVRDSIEFIPVSSLDEVFKRALI